MSERVRLMANNEYDLPDDFDDYDDNGIAQVRKAYKALQRRAKELEQELSGFRSESRKRSVQDVLTSRGFNSKIADLIPSDLTSEEDISVWLDERSDVFQPATPAGQEPVSDEQPNGSELRSPEGFDQFRDAMSAGQPVAGDESQIMAMIQAAKTPDELNQILFGGHQGPNAY
jgi:hypothetical protein